MAINLPQGLYTAGAVPIDISQSTNFANQLAMKQQARQDALNEYYQNTNKDINPNGLRSQDTQGFLDKYSDFTNFYDKNRAAIQNPRLDGGAAQAEYNSRHQDMLAYANTSKNSQAKHEQVAKLKENPSTAYMLNTPDMLPAIKAMEYPINDPRHQDIDIDQMQMNAQPLGIKDLTAIQTGLKKDMKRDTSIGAPIPDQYGNAWQPRGYSPEAKQSYMKGATNYYYSDPKVRYHTESLVTDPTRYNQAVQAFQSVMGRPPQNEAEVFAGEQAAYADLEGKDQVKVTDAPLRSKLTEGRQADQAARQFAYKKAYGNFQKSLTLGTKADEQQRDFETTSNYADSLTDPAFVNKGIPSQDAQGNATTEYEFGTPNDLNKHYREGGAVNGQEASGFRVERNKKYIRAMYPDGTSKVIPWNGFMADLVNTVSPKKGAMRPAPLQSTPGAPAPTTKKLAPGSLD